MPQKPKTVCDECGKSFINVNLHKTKSHAVFELIEKQNANREDDDYWTLKKNGEIICTWQDSDEDGASWYRINRQKKLLLNIALHELHKEVEGKKYWAYNIESVQYATFPLKHENPDCFPKGASIMTSKFKYEPVWHLE